MKAPASRETSRPPLRPVRVSVPAAPAPSAAPPSGVPPTASAPAQAPAPALGYARPTSVPREKAASVLQTFGPGTAGSGASGFQAPHPAAPAQGPEATLPPTVLKTRLTPLVKRGAAPAIGAGAVAPGGLATPASRPAPGTSVQELAPLDIVPNRRPDYRQMPDSERRRYRVAFERQFILLSNLCPKLIRVPEDIWTADLDVINDRYDEAYRQTLEISPFGKLRMGLVIFFLLVEFLGTKVLGLDFSGFTIRQVRRMNIYDPVLMEIGKKYAAAVGGEWAPEYKLAFSALFSAICFVGASYVSKWVGGGTKEVFLNIGDGVVGMVVPGAEAEGPSSAELVPNSGLPNSIGGFLGNLMNLFTGPGSSGSSAAPSARSGGPSGAAARPRARVHIQRTGGK